MKSKTTNPMSARPTPPGASIKHILEDLQITQKEFAAMIERPEQFVSELLRGKRQLTIDTARRLEAAFGTSADFWLRREANYRLRVDPVDAETMERIRSRARVA
jgi:HTH-type transcriptional regulator/antitoxin HigA